MRRAEGRTDTKGKTMDPTVFINVGSPEVRHYRQHSSFSVVRIAEGVRVLFHGSTHETDAEEFASRVQSISTPEALEDFELLLDSLPAPR